MLGSPDGCAKCTLRGIAQLLSRPGTAGDSPVELRKFMAADLAGLLRCLCVTKHPAFLVPVFLSHSRVLSASTCQHPPGLEKGQCEGEGPKGLGLVPALHSASAHWHWLPCLGPRLRLGPCPAYLQSLLCHFCSSSSHTCWLHRGLMSPGSSARVC